MAREIATLLSQDVATINQSPVEARNIAILVQNRYQTNEMKQALRDFNIASVFYSRESELRQLATINIPTLLVFWPVRKAQKKLTYNKYASLSALS